MIANIEASLRERINPIIFEDLLTIGRADLPWIELHKKTILISGGSGFLASYLVQSLLLLKQLYDLDIKVLCVVRNVVLAKERFKPWIEDPSLQIICQDISDPLPIDFPKADFIIHAASQASPKYYGVDPVGTLLANSIGTRNLLDHALVSDTKKFIFFSSGEVYGQPMKNVASVNEMDYGYLDPMNVRSCYAESKRMGETMCVSWANQYNLNVSIVRPFHTYGPGMSLQDGRVFADFVADVVARKDIVLNSDGSALRAFCYLADASIGFLTVLLKGKNTEAYNIGNPFAEISIKELAVTLSKLLPSRQVNVVFKQYNANTKYLQSPIVRVCPSINKIIELGWSPTVGIEQGFQRTIQSFINLRDS